MQIHPDAVRGVTIEAAKSATVATAAVIGLSLDSWLKIVSIAFVLLQGAYLLWKWRREWRSKKRARVVDTVTTPADRQ